MSTEITPPAPPVPAGTDRPRHRTAPRVIALLTAALGVAIVAGTVGSAAVPAIASADARDEHRSLGVAGISTLDVDVDTTGLTVVFADVDEASLDVLASRGEPWTFERDGSTLRVGTPRGDFMFWFSGGNGRATLTLPDELAGLDAEIEVGAGSFDADGDFGAVDLNLSAGQVSVTGTATSLVAEVGAGRGEIDLEGVSTADFSIDAGQLIARLRGAAPDTITASIDAGSLELTLPDETYDVTSDVSAGEVDNQLRSAPGARHTITVDVSAGNALLTAD